MARGYTVSVKSHSRRPRKGGKRARREKAARVLRRSKIADRLTFIAPVQKKKKRKAMAPKPKRRSTRKKRGRDFLGDYAK